VRGDGTSGDQQHADLLASELHESDAVRVVQQHGAFQDRGGAGVQAVTPQDARVPVAGLVEVQTIPCAPGLVS
jgi:hypothetical protein